VGEDRPDVPDTASAAWVLVRAGDRCVVAVRDAVHAIQLAWWLQHSPERAGADRQQPRVVRGSGDRDGVCVGTRADSAIPGQGRAVEGAGGAERAGRWAAYSGASGDFSGD